MNISSILPNEVVDAVKLLGCDPTGKTDIGPIINAFYAANANVGVYPILEFPQGQYLVTTPIVITATNGNQKTIVIRGVGRASYTGSGTVQFLVNTPNAGGLWLNDATKTAGNQNGPKVSGISFIDVTPSNGQKAQFGLRITQFNNIEVDDVAFVNFTGNSYKVGTVTVENGQTAFTGNGTSFTSQMAFGHLQIAGKFQEINSISTATAGEFTSAWQMPSGTYPYLIGYNGAGLMLEGTSASGFTQYGRINDPWGYNCRCWIDVVGSQTNIAGVSRILINGGRLNGEHLADCIGVFLGKFSDTVQLNGMAQNNVAFPVVIEGGHCHLIKALIENAAPFVVVSTLNNGVAEKAGNRGIVINADNIDRVKNNVISDAYVYLVGNAIEIWSPNVGYLYIANNRFDSNINNYAWADGTVGPPVKPAVSVAKTVALINQLDYQGTK